MAVVILHTIMGFCADDRKLTKWGNNAVDFSHAVLFSYNAAQCVLSGKVQPSMKDKTYDIQVNKLFICLLSSIIYHVSFL